jgi:hypothetical protein
MGPRTAISIQEAHIRQQTRMMFHDPMGGLIELVGFVVAIGADVLALLGLTTRCADRTVEDSIKVGLALGAGLYRNHALFQPCGS